MKEFAKITSRDNSLIKFVSALQGSSDKRYENNAFVLEGLRICRDACDNGIRFDKLIISETAHKKYPEEILRFSENSDYGAVVPDSLFKKIGDTGTPQGVMAVCKMPNNSAKTLKRNGRYVALQNISDPSNLGAIARTAEALGADGIILSGGCDPYSPKVLRASMGTLLRMPVFVPSNFTDFFAENGIKTYACVVDRTAESIAVQSLEDGCAVVIGNEANGLDDEMKKKADRLVTIPMSGRAESLNAAAAAAIAIWEMMK